MKRTMLITVIFCVTVASFLIFTADSFSKAPVVKHEGEINGLVFTFDPPLQVTLPVLGYIEVSTVEIKAKGKEHIVYTPSKQYSYNAKFEGSTSDGYDFVFDGDPQPIKLISGSLNEHFTPTDPDFDPTDPEKDFVPDDVDLFFKSVLSIGGNTFSLDLKLKHGDVQILK